MTSVFLSYARGDDDDFVARTYAFLRSRDLNVWWDKESMPSRSLTFTEEIRDAIHHTDRLMVVIGPKALRSDYVRGEWQAALSEHKPVVPILRRVPEGIADPYNCLPAELKHFHAPSFLINNGVEPPLDSLEKIFTDPVPPPAPIFGRPPERPPHFRPRPDKFEEIFGAVLGELSSTDVHTHQERITVLTGMGGVGKTVLAASLVEAMRCRPSTLLEDGIYWLTGPPLLRLAKLCRVSSNDLLDELSMSEALAQHLSGKRFLLVVDNATSVDQIAPLVRLLGPGGRMLVATRNGELAVGRTKIDVDQLSEDDALQLVADWLKASLQEVPPEARRMVQLCGCHPFAISLNAGAASQGLAWSTIVGALERHELDFAEHRFDEYVYDTVKQSLAISVDALGDADRARYLELAAFFWDSAVPARAIASFWKARSGLSEARAQKLMVFFQQRSLIQMNGAPDQYEARLHDLHRAFIESDEGEVAALRDALIESYQPAHRDAWWSVPDDGYFRQHAVRHLMRSRPREVLALLSAEDDDGRNRWYRARTETDGFAGYVADIQLASDHVSDCLLPLITSSLRSLAKTVPGSLMDVAVGEGYWSLEQATARARLPAEPRKQATAMIALLPQVQDRESWLDETLDAVARSEVTARDTLIGSLVAVAETAELLPILRTIVAWVQQATSGYDSTHTKPLARYVLERIPASLAADAIEIVSVISIRPLRLYGLLPEPERSARIRDALDEATGLGRDLDVAKRAMTVRVLAQYLDAESAAMLVAETLAAVRELGPGVMRREILLDLLPCLPIGDQRDVINELITYAGKEPRMFVALATRAPPALHAQIRNALETQSLEWIANAAPAFTHEDREALVERALSEIEERENAASLLWIDGAALTLAMNDGQLERARRVIDARLKDYQRVRALIAVARTISAEKREHTLQDALKAIDALTDANERERAYNEIVPLLMPRQLTEVLAAAERIGEPSGIEYLPKMLRHLSASVSERASEVFVRYAETTPFATWYHALSAIPPGVESEALDRLLELARRLSVHEGKAHLLTALASRVRERDRARTIEEARETIGTCEQSRTRIELLIELGCLDDAEREIEDAASSMKPDELAEVVAKLARHLPAERRDAWVEFVLKVGAQGRYVLDYIAPHLTLEQARTYIAFQIVPEDPTDRLFLYEAMSDEFTVLSVEDKAPTATALAHRIGVLGEADAAFELLRSGRNDDFTATFLVELAPHLSRERVLFVEERVRTVELKSLAVARESSRTILSSTARSYLGGRLAPSLARVGEVSRALKYAHATDEEWRAASYLAIAEVTSGDTRKHALLGALGAVLELREVFRREQVDDVARAIAGDAGAAAAAWPIVVEWARARPRREAIEVLAAFSPVAAGIRGTSLPDEVYVAAERVLRWWP